MITIEDFNKIDMRVGTIIDASINKKARKKAYKLTIDLGELGLKTSSAQITDLYDINDLYQRQVIVIVNFAPIRIGDIKSEVRLLGADTKEGCLLLELNQKVPNGTKIF